jgi:uncharacterized membrane protein
VSGGDPVWALSALLVGMAVAVALSAPSRAVPVFAVFALLLGATLHWRPLWMIYLPPTAFDLLIAWLFGRTLMAGRTPLIEQYMRIIHAELPPRLVSYGRLMTGIWTSAMAVLGVLAAVLALLGHALAWSVLVNVVSYLIVAALFVCEWLFRLVWFPAQPMYRSSPLSILRVVVKSRLLRLRPHAARARL